VLADRMAAAERAGIDIGALAVTAVGLRPLPDELPAAALWWRLSEHLGPAVVEAATASPARTLRPDWTPALTTVLGDDLAQRVLADPAWPALVTAVDTATHHGWTAEDVLRTAAELLHAATDQDAPRVRAGELATALGWRVDALTTPDHDDAPAGDLVDPDEQDCDLGYDPSYDEAPADAHTVLDDLDSSADHVVAEVTGQVDTTAADPGTAPGDDLAVADGAVEGGVEGAGDWDGALLLELPYTDLPATGQVAQISTDLQAARDAVRATRTQLLTDTGPYLQAVMPMLIAMRTRADELRPLAAIAAAAHELWIEAEHAVETAEHDVATLTRALTAATTGDGANTADVLRPQLASARDVAAHTRSEVTARRMERDIARAALQGAAGPEGVVTGADVDQVRVTAESLDLQTLTDRRETVRALEGALLRAENRAAHEHARTELAPSAATAPSSASTSSASPAVQGGAVDTAAQGTAVLEIDPVTTTARPTVTVTPQSAPSPTIETGQPGWRRLLGPRPTEPARAAQWEQTQAAVAAYRAIYNVTDTNPLTPLGSAPTAGSDQAPVYRAITKQWRAAMTITTTTPQAGDTPSTVATRLAEVEQRLAHLREQRELRRNHTHTSVTPQDGITDDHGYGHDTGHNATEQNRRSGTGWRTS
jgi:hypothetical protein